MRLRLMAEGVVPSSDELGHADRRRRDRRRRRVHRRVVRQGRLGGGDTLLVLAGIPPIIALASPLPRPCPAPRWRGTRTGRSASSTGRWWSGRWRSGSPRSRWARAPRPAGSVATTWSSSREVLMRGARPAVRAPTGQSARRAVDIHTPHAGMALVAVGRRARVRALANAGGFLLAPLYLLVLHLPIKQAFSVVARGQRACSRYRERSSTPHSATSTGRSSSRSAYASIRCRHLGARVAMRHAPGKPARLRHRAHRARRRHALDVVVTQGLSEMNGTDPPRSRHRQRPSRPSPSPCGPPGV